MNGNRANGPSTSTTPVDITAVDWQPVPVEVLFPDTLNYNRRTREGKENYARREAYRQAVDAMLQARTARNSWREQALGITQELSTCVRREDRLIDNYNGIRRLLDDTLAIYNTLAIIVRRTGLEATNFRRERQSQAQEIQDGTTLVFDLGPFRAKIVKQEYMFSLIQPGTTNEMRFDINERGNLSLKDLLALDGFIAAANLGKAAASASMPASLATQMFDGTDPVGIILEGLTRGDSYDAILARLVAIFGDDPSLTSRLQETTVGDVRRHLGRIALGGAGIMPPASS